MINKKIVAVITVITILGGATTAFAANENKEAITAVKMSIKKNVEAIKGKKGVVANAFEAKKSEKGFVQLDKSKFTQELQNIKNIKSEVEQLGQKVKAAKEAGNKEEFVALKLQVLEKTREILKSAQALAPYKEQYKENKEVRVKLQPLKESLKSFEEQRTAIHEQNKSIAKEINGVKEELKAVDKEGNPDKVAELTGKILEKLNVLNNNLEKLNNLKDEAVKTINEWK